MNKFLFFLTLLFTLCINPCAKVRCGTINLMEFYKTPVQIAARTVTKSCNANDYYDSVYVKTTAHFAVFYTLEGPHATIEPLVDSLSNALESAYTLFTVKHKTKIPKGFTQSYQYKQIVPENLYPVEIVNFPIVRNITSLIGDNCSMCYGLTIPDLKDSEKTNILVSNDFQYSLSSSANAYYVKDSLNCPYFIKNMSFVNNAHDYAFASNFGPATRITAFHEFYHAVQNAYLPISKYNNFWFEASASGIEEIGAPDVDDYESYITPLFKANWESLYDISNSYALAPLYIYLYNSFGPTFDTKIWEEFAKNKNKSFEEQFISTATSFDSDADSLFHDFAIRLYFSGKNFDSTFQITLDQKDWPNIVPQSSDIINSENAPYLTYRKTSAYPENNSGTVSYLLKEKNSYSVLKINSYADYRKNYSNIFLADSAILVYSKLFSKNVTTETSENKKFFAYPNPWKGSSPLCFTGLSSSKDILEIRSRTGTLVYFTTYKTSEFCIAESTVKSVMAPGLYFYRTGRSGKMKKLILLY